MDDTMMKLRAFFKAQSALTRIELRAKGTQAVYVALALVFGLLGLGMLNVGAFLALEPIVGAAWSALLLGIGDILLAVFIAKMAAGVEPGPEADSARELRDLVLESLQHDAEQVRQSVTGVASDLQRVRNVFSSGSSVVGGVSSVVGLLTSALQQLRC